VNSNPSLSVIVVFHNMAREAPRTLFTLSPQYQRGVGTADYEVIALDAGSATPLEENFVKSFGENFQLVRAPAAPSPVVAVNRAATLARGEAIALCIDGARMLTPGILRLMLDAFKIWNDPVVATLAWHLGPKIQNESLLEGYNQATEDALPDSVDWHSDGYELFRISSLAASSKDGWFCSIGESNCLAVRRETWRGFGGLHEGFVSPGGGLVNLDFYREACRRLATLVILLGEGTFHQFHGGVATNSPAGRNPVEGFVDEYRRNRCGEYAVENTAATYLGSIPHQASGFLLSSATKAQEAQGNL
jgi:hypothetical protein